MKRRKLDNDEEHKFSIELDNNSSIGHRILRYAATFNNISNYTCERYYKNDLDKLVPLLLLPYGISKIEYLNQTIEINYQRVGEPVGTQSDASFFEKLVISTYGDRDVIIQFMNDARECYEPKTKDKVVCQIMKNGYWTVLSKLPKRNLDTIYLDKDTKKNILDDINLFLNSEKIYIEMGIPYKRNYMLEGYPGTGKTSLIFAIASKLNMNLSIINFGPDIDDTIFMSSISNMPDNSILILEDIDALFVERKAKDSSKSMVSFSGILNILDGIGRKHKLITFMTTNYIDRLDPALIRPGRIDYVMHFDYVTKSQIKKMFRKFFPDNENIESFIKEIRGIKTTTATLQKFFFNYRDKNILEHIEKLKEYSEVYNKDKISMYS